MRITCVLACKTRCACLHPNPWFPMLLRIIHTLKQKCPQAATIIVAAACQQLALQCSCSHLNCSSTHLYHHTSTASSSIHLRWNHRRRSFLSFQHKMDQQCVLPSNTHANITSSNMNSKTATQLQANTHVRFWIFFVPQPEWTNHHANHCTSC